MKLELYLSETSPYSRKVRVMLLEKDVPFSLIDIRKGERQAKEANPLGKVPTLLVDGVPLVDSVVMTEYLDAVFPLPLLIPPTPYERAMVRRYEALADGISDVLVPVVYDRKRPENVQNTAMTEAYIDKARATLQFLDQDCQGRHYLHGDVFSLADIAVVAALGYVNLRLPELLAGYDQLNRYHERQLERPSLAETVPPNLPTL
jgi:glutathione S-transferase